MAKKPPFSDFTKTPKPPEAPESDPMEGLSALQIVDLLAMKAALGEIDHFDFANLRVRVEELEETQDEARTALEKMGQTVEKLTSPAFRTATLLAKLEGGRALVCVNGSDFVSSVSPQIPPEVLETGLRLLMNEAYAVVGVLGHDQNGPIVRIQETLADGRLRVGAENGPTDGVVLRSSALVKEKLKAGLEVRLDSNQRVAVEVIGTGKRLKRTLSTVEDIPWESIGGQKEALEAIRDSIELPYLHAELFRKFKHPVPKGFLLYGPPGCGKTLLGKATASNLRKQIREKTGEDRPEYFLHVKGPEILNMWLGESERQVRDLFAQCREKAAEGQLAFLFIDEAESVLGTRMAGRLTGNISNTLVPMFCTEMDGLEPLQNVVVILASNRADLIDPAILRAGRIDRKIRVRRPDEDAAREIYKIYLGGDLPLAEPGDVLADAVAKEHYARTDANRFLEISYRSGKSDHLYRGDMASGALIAAIVERAKDYAIRRSIDAGDVSPISRADLLKALAQEYKENELFPAGAVTEDWLKLTDFNPANVVSLGPVAVQRKKAATGAV